MSEEIVNRVTQSSLVTVDMDEYIDRSEVGVFDIKKSLYQDVLLKEREFRQYLKDYNWETYRGQNVRVFCSTDAIIPSWAYMLIAAKLHNIARMVVLGTKEGLEKALIDEAIEKILKLDLKDAKVVIKGCGNISGRDYAYFTLAKRLLPIVSSMMYGEPCSTVPVYKRR